jgi:hypothetical protein
MNIPFFTSIYDNIIIYNGEQLPENIRDSVTKSILALFNRCNCIYDQKIFRSHNCIWFIVSKNISEYMKQKYSRIQGSLAHHESNDMLLTKSTMDVYNIIIPPKKIVKVWSYDNNPPKILGEGVHYYAHIGQICLIWLGSIKYKDDIPDNFELVNFKNFE